MRNLKTLVTASGISEVDHGASEADERQDRAAADRSQTSASDASRDRVYDASTAERADAAASRESTAAARAAMGLTRSREGMRRDDAARLRDLSALARDRTSEARDRAAGRRAAALAEKAGTKEEMIKTFEGIRARAAGDRERAAADRRRAAEDRTKAARDRSQARTALHEAYLDDLTGVYTRGVGMLTLRHEVDRAHRSGEPLVLAMIDVDGLKQVNDSGGHAAGDALLRDVAAAIQAKLRSYDPVVRMGGDEFICAFPNTAFEPATQQMAEMQAVLSESQPSDSFSVGFAELRPKETLEDLLARGDAELYRVKAVR